MKPKFYLTAALSFRILAVFACNPLASTTPKAPAGDKNPFRL
jgi:hypothetical protein